MTWQRFDTMPPAPDHDFEFIAFRPDAGVFCAVWLYPSHPDEPGTVDFEQPPSLFASVGGDDITTHDHPTHWMPLPAPPSEAQR